MLVYEDNDREIGYQLLLQAKQTESGKINLICCHLE